MSPSDRRLDMAAGLAGWATRTRIELRRLLDATELAVKVEPADGTPALLAAAAVVSMGARVVGQVVASPIPLPRNPWGARTLRGVATASRLVHRPNGATTRTITICVGGSGGGAGGSGGGGGRVVRSGGSGGGGQVPAAADIYLGGDDWTAVVSRVGPVGIGRCPLGGPGLQAAAALAFGEALKDLLGPVGMRCVPIDRDLEWNLRDGRVEGGPASGTVGGAADRGSRGRSAPPPSQRTREPVTMPRVALLGSGSVGSSAAAVLSMTRLVGTADVVDPDRFEPHRNAYRCPGVPAAETGPKSAWAARILHDSGWVTQAHAQSVAKWIEARPDPGFHGIALVSVDNVDGRRDAGDLVAATTISAGVSGAALHVQRHLALDSLACPYCELVDARRWRDHAEVYARLGLTVTRLQELLDGAPLSVDDVTTAIWAGSLDPSTVDDLPGGRLTDLLRRHYAAVSVRRGDAAWVEDVTRVEDVSAPHVSWLAGTLLAAEVAKAAVGLPGLDRRVDIDLTGVPLGGWRRPPRDPSGRCPCTTSARDELARALYAT